MEPHEVHIIFPMLKMEKYRNTKFSGNFRQQFNRTGIGIDEIFLLSDADGSQLQIFFNNLFCLGYIRQFVRKKIILLRIFFDERERRIIAENVSFKP